MHTRRLGVLSFIALVVTALWLVLLIANMANAGPLDTFERVLAHVSKLDVLFYLSYLNAALTVLAATALFTGLYLYSKSTAPASSLVGLVFVPIYATMNLFVYLSQITIVPHLVPFLSEPEYAAATNLMLRQLIQEWPASGVSFFHNLAYGLLGIPSILFGLILFRRSLSLRLGGILLALNGVACILGVVGILIGSELLGLGSVVGGVFFLIALIPLGLTFWRET